MLIFDLETNGLLDAVTKVHLLVIKDTDSGERFVYRHGNIGEGLERLSQAQEAGRVIGGHNVVKFDVPVLRKLYPHWQCSEKLVLDTICLSRLMYPDLWDKDRVLVAAKTLPTNLMNSHKLEAWGRRLGVHKGDYTGGWEQWSQAMEDYCIQDVEVTEKLWRTLLASKLYPGERAVRLEHDVLWIVARQERHGFLVDQTKLRDLIVRLAKERHALEQTLVAEFGQWYAPGPLFVPKVNNASQGYVKGAAFSKVSLTTFNPSSRSHIANRLKKVYGWKPVEFTDKGEVKVDEETMKTLPWPVARTLERYLTIDKRCGQLSDGTQAWVRSVAPDGRIHGSVNTNGAVTGRMTHSRPNMAQAPASRSLYGTEFRELLTVPKGKALVGCDADGLELRDLAGYMAPYDGGAYVQTILSGDKKLGTDAHSVNARAFGLDPTQKYFGDETGRDIAKTGFYALIYGAGDEKLGITFTRQRKPMLNRKAGKDRRTKLMQGLPAYGKLVDAVQRAAKQRGGYLRGLDGRFLLTRSEHAALNTLLQSAGAVQMKQALVILDQRLQEMGFVPGKNYEFVANVHDEWQIECDEAIAELVGQTAADSIRLAGEAFDFACPLAGNYVVGKTWADTH